MAGRAFLARAEPGFTLPALERLAPPPPPDLVAARIEAFSAPGDIVADLHGRGGWIARAAIGRQRRALTLESSPLARLLAEIVLRPPDIRHLDAAFGALGASPRGETSLKLAIGELFATRCATCERALIADEIVWLASEGQPAVPSRKLYRCTVCRAQRGGAEQRQAPVDAQDLARSTAEVGADDVRRRLAERFPVPEGGGPLVGELLALHTDRQLIGLAAILERVEGDLRASPVEAALRLAFIHAILPASRLHASPGRTAALRIVGGHVRPPTFEQWRERNPWLAFEDGFRHVRGFVQRLESGSLGPVQARLGTDLRSLGEGVATGVVAVSSQSSIRALAREPRAEGRTPAIRLVLSQPPLRPGPERVAAAFHATAWGLGREAASLLPVEPLLGPSVRPPWSWQSAALRRSLEAAGPHLARDGRVVLLLEGGGPEGLAAAVLGGVAAGYRLVAAQLAEPDEETGGIVELIPPGAPLPPGPRTRSNVPLPPVPGGAGDPEVVAGRGLFARPERIDARPFSASEAARSVTETAVEVLKARGEPARHERLLGEILVGLDRTGQLGRLVLAESAADGGAAASGANVAPGRQRSRLEGRGSESDPAEVADKASAAGDPTASDPAAVDPTAGDPTVGDPAGSAGRPMAGQGSARAAAGPGGGQRPEGRQPDGSMVTGPRQAEASTVTGPRRPASRAHEVPADPVERLVALVRDELQRPGQRRLVEIEPGRWWLADRSDREAAAAPLADRVEWAVYSLLSTAGRISEAAFFERIATLFTGHDLPDETLVRACLESYRSPASTPDGLVTVEDLRRRTHEHTDLLARLANGGHRLGLEVWLGRREQGRRLGKRLLGEWLDDRERDAWLPGITRAPSEELEAVDCIWYARHRAAFMFEVEWTAMLGEPLLRRHARIPSDPSIVRFLVVAPERTELVRFKLERSPLLREAIEAGPWHIVKWDHLRAWLDLASADLDTLEPYLGLDPLVERRGEQLSLFEGPGAVP